MAHLQTVLLLVFISGQICASQIFGGHGHGPPPPGPGGGRGGPHRGGILNPDARGGIFGGQGIGPGGREGILRGMNNIPGGHTRPPGGGAPTKKDRIRMGPIIFDTQHLEHDDNDDYSDDVEDEDAYQRPHMGLDLSTIFVPLANFLKLTAKSLEAIFNLLEKQANLLLGMHIRKYSRAS